jgi:membrane associated rhomboid family serine protease
VGLVLAVFALMGLVMGVFGPGGTAVVRPGIAWSGLVGAVAVSAGLAYLLLLSSAARMNRMEWTG